MSAYTKEEAFLQALATRSFLRFWSWANLFRDQGHTSAKGDGKEICDLVVIFGNDILLFSDKKIHFNENKDISTAWARWARKAIQESMKQTQGAMRWISKHPERVFIDNKCTKKIPIDIPSSIDTKFHQIIVCHGVEDAIININHEASFSFDNSIIGSDHWTTGKCPVFSIGLVSKGEFIHVFNEKTIQLVMNEFNTAKDFIDYLRQRRKLISFNQPIKIKSESDIIQIYYENFNKKTYQYNILAAKELEDNPIVIDKGGINNLYSNPYFLAKKQQDKASYFWDNLVEVFSFHILNGTSESNNWETPNEIEPAIRQIAKFGRFERRVLSISFFDFYEKAKPNLRGTRVEINPLNSKEALIYFMLPYTSVFRNYKEYRNMRKNMLEDYCIINKFKLPHIDHFIGIACETRRNDTPLNGSFFDEGQDFIYLDASNWQNSDFENAEEIYNEYVNHNMLATRKPFTRNSSDFPTNQSGLLNFDTRTTLKGKDRNKPCICGSGKKLKKCCGKA